MKPIHISKYLALAQLSAAEWFYETWQTADPELAKLLTQAQPLPEDIVLIAMYRRARGYGGKRKIAALAASIQHHCKGPADLREWARKRNNLTGAATSATVQA